MVRVWIKSSVYGDEGDKRDLRVLWKVKWRGFSDGWNEGWEWEDRVNIVFRFLGE